MTSASEALRSNSAATGTTIFSFTRASSTAETLGAEPSRVSNVALASATSFSVMRSPLTTAAVPGACAHPASRAAVARRAPRARIRRDTRFLLDRSGSILNRSRPHADRRQYPEEPVEPLQQGGIGEGTAAELRGLREGHEHRADRRLEDGARVEALEAQLRGLRQLHRGEAHVLALPADCLLYTSPSPRD